MIRKKRTSCRVVIEVIANILTIFGVLIAVVALYYGFQQYKLYKKETSKKPNLEFEFFVSGVIKDNMVEFNNQKISNILPIKINLINKGNADSKSISFTINFTKNVNIKWVRGHLDEPINIPLKGQLFTYDDLDFIVPYSFQGILVLTVFAQFNGNYSKDLNHLLVGNYQIKCEGGLEFNKDIYFNCKNHQFSYEEAKSKEANILAPLKLDNSKNYKVFDDSLNQYFADSTIWQFP